MDLKDIVLISRSRVVNPSFKPNETEEKTFKIDFFLVLQVSYQEMNQVVFRNRFIKRVKLGKRGCEYVLT